MTLFADATLAVGLLAIPILILINAFFVSAEFALVAVRRTRVEELVNSGKPRAASLLKSIDELNDSVAASQLGITIASLALGLVSEPALRRLIQPLFETLPDGWQGPLTRTISVVLTLACVTFLHVVFGEQMPKMAALQSTEKIGLIIAPPLNLFARTMRPLLRLMNGTSNRFLRVLGYKPATEDGEVYSVDELRLLIEDTEEAGLLDAEQADACSTSFALSEQDGPRHAWCRGRKMAALDVNDRPGQGAGQSPQGAHTRMPVYNGTPDNIVGVVNTKDLFYLFSLSGVVHAR